MNGMIDGWGYSTPWDEEEAYQREDERLEWEDERDPDERRTEN